MPEAVVKIGPAEHGTRMDLPTFDRAEVQDGFNYELARGVVTVIEVPRPRHLAQVNAIRRQFAAYDVAHPGRIDTLASGGECKILVPSFESERHPDLAVYLQPLADDEDVWATSVPDLVVEVVSPGSEQRDYEDKREEYLAFGVREYWIVDYQKHQMLVLQRSGDHWREKVIEPPTRFSSPLLPGFEFDVEPVFAAAAKFSR